MSFTHQGERIFPEEPAYDFTEWDKNRLKYVGSRLKELVERPSSEPHSLPEEARLDAEYSLRHMVLELYFKRGDEAAGEEKF